jgi:integrase
MNHVYKRPNGIYQVEIKVPLKLRGLIGCINLRQSLGSRVLDASTRRKADPIITDFLSRIAKAEQQIAGAESDRRAELEQEENQRFLRGMGMYHETPLTEMIQFAASGWPNKEASDNVFAEIVNRLRASKNPAKEVAKIEAFTKTISQQLEAVKRVLGEAEAKPSTATVKTLDSVLTITGLLEKFAATETPKIDTLRQYRTAVKLFCDSQSDMAITDIDRTAARGFRDYLHKREDMSFSTCDHRLKQISALFNFAVRDNFGIQTNPFTGMKVKEATKQGHGEAKPRDYVVPEVINVYLTEFLPQFGFHDSMRWPFLIMQQTGMRIEEVCGLRLDEILTPWGTLCFHIRERPEDNRTVKTKDARYCPISDHLWETLGLRKFVEARKKAGETMLFDFPRWRGKHYSGKFSEKMTALRAAYGEKHTLDLADQHSLRHTLNTLLQEAGISHEQRCQIAGHAFGSRINAGYGDRDASLAHLKAAINSIDLSRYDYSKLLADIP